MIPEPPAPAAETTTAPKTGSLAEHVARLEEAFRVVAATRMQGVPVLNAQLAVQGLGFEAEAAGAGVALGVLVTPWFMSLVRLPLSDGAAAAMLAVGHKSPRDCGPRRFEFIGAFDETVGAYETASLFSPMFEFQDQAAALATARELLALLRPQPAAVVAHAVVSAAVPAAPIVAEAQPARRGFLFGRSAAGAGGPR